MAPLAAAAGGAPQRVMVTGGPRLALVDAPAPLVRGPVKMVWADYSPPDHADLVRWIVAAHDAGRPVAVHCVTRPGLGAALAAWDEAGVMPGDRIEHGSVVPPDLRSRVASRGLAVVTQPGFVLERGDRYLAEVHADDLPHLYPCRSLIEAGIAGGRQHRRPVRPPRPVAGHRRRDRAPHGRGDPARGARGDLAERALALFLTPPEAPAASSAGSRSVPPPTCACSTARCPGPRGPVVVPRHAGHDDPRAGPAARRRLTADVAFAA